MLISRGQNSNHLHNRALGNVEMILVSAPFLTVKSLYRTLCDNTITTYQIELTLIAYTKRIKHVKLLKQILFKKTLLR